MTDTKIGFIGVGRLGLPLASSLVDAGYSVLCTTRGRCEELVAKGATVPGDGTPRAVATEADVLFTCMPSVSAFDTVMTGESGVLSAQRTSLVVFEMSTLPLEAKRLIRDSLAARGGDLMDSPVSGTPPMATAKIAVIYSSGHRAIHDRYEHLLKAMSPNEVYVGEFGAGTKMKYVAQFLATIHVTAAAEAMAFAELAGLDLTEVGRIISASPGAVSGQFQIRAQMIAERRFEGKLVTVEATLKDVAQVMQHSTEIGAPTDLLSVVNKRFHNLAAAGDLHADPAKLFLTMLDEAKQQVGTA